MEKGGGEEEEGQRREGYRELGSHTIHVIKTDKIMKVKQIHPKAAELHLLF